MILYTLPHSSYGTKVAIVIAIKGIEDQFEVREPPGGLRTDSYRGVIPMRQIPAIVDGDLTISESEVISEYLNERFPEPPLLPDDPQGRARSRFFSRFHDIHLEPPIRNLFWQVPERTRNLAIVDENLARIGELIERFSAMAAPEPYLAGARISLADCAYPSTLMYLDLVTQAMGRSVTYPANIAAWREVVLAHPAVAQAMAVNRAAGKAWIPKKLAE